MTKIDQELAWIKKKNNNFSLYFLIFVLVLTIWLYGYNFYEQSQISKIENTIQEKQKALSEKKRQKNIVVYNLYNSNKWVFKKLEKYSKIADYITHLDQIWYKYSLNFKWFSYSNWELSTKAYSISDNNAIDYQKTVNFLRKYSKDKQAKFIVEPLNSVKTKDDRQEFNLKFKLK